MKKIVLIIAFSLVFSVFAQKPTFAAEVMGIDASGGGNGLNNSMCSSLEQDGVLEDIFGQDEYLIFNDFLCVDMEVEMNYWYNALIRPSSRGTNPVILTDEDLHKHVSAYHLLGVQDYFNKVNYILRYIASEAESPNFPEKRAVKLVRFIDQQMNHKVFDSFARETIEEVEKRIEDLKKFRDTTVEYSNIFKEAGDFNRSDILDYLEKTDEESDDSGLRDIFVRLRDNTALHEGDSILEKYNKMAMDSLARLDEKKNEQNQFLEQMQSTDDADAMFDAVTNRTIQQFDDMINSMEEKRDNIARNGVQGKDIWGTTILSFRKDVLYSLEALKGKLGIVTTNYTNGGYTSNTTPAKSMPIERDKQQLEATMSVPVKPSASAIIVDGQAQRFEVYNIHGNNYFKLRDLAMAVTGSKKQFEVSWGAEKNAINLISASAYTPVGGEMEVPAQAKSTTGKPTPSKIYKDGLEIQLTAYNIGGNNYFKLRDIAQAFNIGVIWDAQTQTIAIDTSIDYIPE